MSKCKIALVVALTIPMSTAAIAHHSGAMWDRTKTVQVQGTLIAFEFQNPHPWIRLMTVQGGKQQEFDVEGGSVDGLMKAGLSPATLKPGDKVKVSVYPMRDGRPAGDLKDITLANGHFINIEKSDAIKRKEQELKRALQNNSHP